MVLRRVDAARLSRGRVVECVGSGRGDLCPRFAVGGGGMSTVDHIAGHTWHGRKGAVENAFRYGVDYVLLDAEADPECPRLFGRNRAALASVRDQDHGGPPCMGRGPLWVREVLRTHGLPAPARIELLTQPRILGHVFNPVSFWICRDEQGALRSVISE